MNAPRWTTCSFVLFGFLLTACIPLPIPHKESMTPLVTGIIVDDRTLQPITGVTVTISSDPKATVNSVLITTDHTGHFEGQVLIQRWFYFLWLGPFDPTCSFYILAEHPAYKNVSDERHRFGYCGTKNYTHDMRMKRLPNE